MEGREGKLTERIANEPHTCSEREGWQNRTERFGAVQIYSVGIARRPSMSEA
jgi:hypothetical protein